MMQSLPDPRVPATATETAALLAAVVLARAAVAPDAAAYFHHQAAGAPKELRFGDLADGARAVARSLVAAGCAPGMRVALMCGHGPDFMTGLLGAFLAGCAALPVAPPTGPVMRARAQAILAEAGCAAVLIGGGAEEASDAGDGDPLAGHRTIRIGEDAPAIALPPLSTRPEDVAVVQFTSGSTAAPRGVVVTHGALLAQQRAIERAVQPQGEERVVTWLPPEHDMGLMGGLMFNLWRGQTTWVISPAAFIRRPILWLEAISRQRATISVAPNFAYDLCVRAISPERRAGLDLSSWRVALNGAEPVQPETMERFVETFGAAGFDARTFMPCYGLAEATLLVSGASRGMGAACAWFDGAALEQGLVVPTAVGQGRRLASSGPVRTTGGVRIVTPDTGQPCPPDRIGEIWIAGDSLGSGYLGRPEDSQRTFAARTVEGDGPYLRSGDLGFLWSGELSVTGRIKDVVLSHGRSLHAADLERSLDGAEARVRSGRIAVHQLADGAVVLAAEVAPARGAEAEIGGATAEARLAGRLWRRLLGQAGVEVARVLLVRPGTLLWTSSGKLRRKASFGRAGDEPDRVVLDWRPDGGEARRAQAAAARQLALAHGPQGAPATAFLRFFEDWIAAATGVDAAEVDPGLPWSDQGLDSLMMTDLVLDLEAATGRQIPAERLFDLPDPRTLAADLAGGAR